MVIEAAPEAVFDSLTQAEHFRRWFGAHVDIEPYPGWAGWLSGIAELRRYHEVAGWRSIWRRVEAPGVPTEMFTLDA